MHNDDELGTHADKGGVCQVQDLATGDEVYLDDKWWIIANMTRTAAGGIVLTARRPGVTKYQTFQQDDLIQAWTDPEL